MIIFRIFLIFWSLCYIAPVLAQEQGSITEFQRYQQAASNGDADAMYHLGVLYTIGKGVKQDFAAARSWYERSAAAGNVSAMNKMGELYSTIFLDYGQARIWFEHAAAKGSGEAMANLGLLYATGRGVAQDYSIAKVWLERAVTAGFQPASAMLDNMRREGH